MGYTPLVEVSHFHSIYSFDIVLSIGNPPVKLAIEVEGPRHFKYLGNNDTNAPFEKQYTPRGETRLRNRIISRSLYKVMVVTWHHWRKNNDNENTKREFLRARIAAAIVPRVKPM